MNYSIKEKWIKCRKRHTCYGCGKIIHINENAHVQTGVYENSIYNIYMCEFCEIVFQEIDWYDAENLNEYCLSNTEEYQYAESITKINSGIVLSGKTF